MHLADTLSHAYVLEVNACAELQELEEVNHTLSLSLTPENIQRLQHASAQDMAMQEFCRVIQPGWPTSKAGLPDAVRPYFDVQDELTV